MNSNHHDWQQVMEEEYKSLVENDTWELTLLPKDCQVIGSRWVYKIKQNGNGMIEQFKAHFIVKGYSQDYGVDYDETFLPVFKLTSLRILLAIGAMLNLEIHQMDVKTAFLNGDIDMELYIHQPQGYEQRNDKGNELVCKLHKGLYGLKQAVCLWN